jgi:acylphosphatase
MQRLQVVFRGRVQGVGFRATTRALAAGFAVSGWVRNEPDSSVLAEVQGDPAQVEAFLAALREQMRRHIVAESAMPAASIPGEVGFEVRR